ncbi:MAG: sigma-70 family RNA polymerase sigma factor [Planctomycetes bacterium]|nr:sigma-70 family RNA polymerase sigma factor [Planctomycetota bacterium]
MSDHAVAFRDLFRQVCEGDEQAACELLQRYQGDLRILARVRLNDPNLRRALDSMDICQSVFGAFFARAAAGQIELETPQQFLKLMATMIHNKVIDYARRYQSRRRNVRMVLNIDVQDMHLAGHDPTASQEVSGRELEREFRQRLSDDELRMAELRKDGRGWDEIAGELGGTPESLRKKLTRAIDRICRELELGF